MKLTSHSVRRCRGHWHVTCGDMDIHDPAWPSDKFETFEEAVQAAWELEYADALEVARDKKAVP